MLDRSTIEFIAAHRCEDPGVLALQAKRYPQVNMCVAVTQIEGWQSAKDKLPTWAATDGVLYPPRISMEQCSSEATALYKSALADGELLADLTGGFGIDCSYMSRNFRAATYIERSAELCEIAKMNFGLLGLGHISVVNGDSVELLSTLPRQDWIFVDPARRDGDGRKVVALSDCEPDVTSLESLLLQKGRKIMVKCSPMLDITAAMNQLKSVEAVHVVAVNNECKELLFILGEAKGLDAPVYCSNINKGCTTTFTFTFANEERAVALYAGSVGRYLYEPDASVLKGGGYRSLSQRYGVAKLHPNSQLYTGEALLSDFPGRKFLVERVVGFSKAEIKEIQALRQANITVRNFPDSVQMLRKKLKLADGGERYIFATTMSDGKRSLVVCRKA